MSVWDQGTSLVFVFHTTKTYMEEEKLHAIKSNKASSVSFPTVIFWYNERAQETKEMICWYLYGLHGSLDDWWSYFFLGIMSPKKAEMVSIKRQAGLQLSQIHLPLFAGTIVYIPFSISCYFLLLNLGDAWGWRLSTVCCLFPLVFEFRLASGPVCCPC